MTRFMPDSRLALHLWDANPLGHIAILKSSLLLVRDVHYWSPVTYGLITGKTGTYDSEAVRAQAASVVENHAYTAEEFRSITECGYVKYYQDSVGGIEGVIDGTHAINAWLDLTAKLFGVRWGDHDLLMDEAATQAVVDIYESNSPFTGKIITREQSGEQGAPEHEDRTETNWGIASWIAVTAAHFCVLRLVPHIVQYPVEEILEGREKHAGSLNAFHDRITELATASIEVATLAEATDIIGDVARELDRDYRQLQRELKGSRFLQVARERVPVIAGTSIVVAGSAALADPMVAALVAGANTIGQVVTITLESIGRRRRLRADPLYWSVRFSA